MTDYSGWLKDLFECLPPQTSPVIEGLTTNAEILAELRDGAISVLADHLAD